MKASHNNIVVGALLMVSLVLVYEAEVCLGVTCDPLELSPCLSAIVNGSPPSKQCCTKLKQQVPCLCQYIKDPNFSKYVTNPNAKKVASACGVTIPTC
ncbi:hypothetical protein Acr_23g0006160 [Actinidia rufa]|uniref:Bifunctional inhibitor/plant lipid transfer protein/seed storage helical domain-containing protein n=1 Tax=Actinidia rufa TaxID=165716 RepID=A0A7J0GN85_9ERIC|nr:hypothetical protein Acr_23g0006160 [Actinidia rufa]